MPTGTRTTDTFQEGLRKLLSTITDLKLTEDADLPFAIGMETQVLSYLKQGAQAAMAPGGPQPPAPNPLAQAMGGGVPGGAAPPGPPPGAAAPPGLPPPGLPPPGLAPAAVPGLMQGPNLPNPDELRRMLTSGTPASRQGPLLQRLAGM